MSSILCVYCCFYDTYAMKYILCDIKRLTFTILFHDFIISSYDGLLLICSNRLPHFTKSLLVRKSGGSSRKKAWPLTFSSLPY